jgi:CelD/BcsL family acetyltransferase involved in cellulose biosynthesis
MPDIDTDPARDPTSTASLSVDFFESPLTPIIWGQFESAPNSAFGCAREYLEHFDDPSGAVVAFVRDKRIEHPRAAFLYTIRGRTCRILGKLVSPRPVEFEAFLHAVLARHSMLTRVETGLMDAVPRTTSLSWPLLTSHVGCDIRMRLPADVPEFERTLEPKFLKRAHYYKRRFKREFPRSAIVAFERDQITSSLVSDIVRLNHERMRSKDAHSDISPDYERGILIAARAQGTAIVLRDGDRLCAGSIIIRNGDHASLWVIAHDNQYSKFSPGVICAFAGILHSIERGASLYHFLWGESPYKISLGGSPHPIASYVVLRSWRSLRPSDLWRAAVAQARRLARAQVARFREVSRNLKWMSR